MPNITSATLVSYRNGTEYILAVATNPLTVERLLEDGTTWVEMENSPVAVGSTVGVLTHSHSSNLRFTPTTGTSNYVFQAAKAKKY